MPRRSTESTTTRLLSRRRKPAARLLVQTLQPDLMKTVHSIRHQQPAQTGHPTMLSFFCQHHAALPVFLNRPSVISVHSHSTRRPGDPFTLHKLFHFGFDRDSERLPSELHAQREIRTAAVRKDDVGGIDVPLRPLLRANQPSPNG